MTIDVEKRCGCPEARWTKCSDHPWYLKKIRYKKREYAPNLTRYALEVLGRPHVTNTKTEALDIGDIAVRAIRTGTYIAAKHYHPPPPVVAAPPSGRTLAAIGEDFYQLQIRADPDKCRNSKVNDQAILTRLYGAAGADGRPLGPRPLATLTVADLIAFRAAVQDLANSTWNKYRTLLGQLFRWAHEKGHIPRDPLASATKDDLKLLRRAKAAKRSREIPEAEFEQLLDAAIATRFDQAATRLYAILIALVETGCRLGELLALQWRDVVLEARTFTVRAEEEGGAKTGARPVPISELLALVLEPLRLDPAGQPLPPKAYVFGTEYGERVKSIDKAVRTALLRAHHITPGWTATGDYDAATRAALKAINFQIRDLRHEAGMRWLRSQQFDLEQIRVRLGHTNIAQTSTYLQASGASILQSQQAYDAARGYRRPKGGRSGDKLGTNRLQRMVTAVKAVSRKATKLRIMK